MRAATLTLFVHLLGVDYGAWCDHCLLPSAVSIRTAISTSATFDADRVQSLAPRTLCPTCGWATSHAN